jgi:thiazole synthase ThiGH ThiG subunit
MSKNTILLALTGAVFAVAFALPQKSGAESNQEAALTAQILKEIKTQQVKLNENQKVLDDKLQLVGEDIRLARAFGSRGK